VIDLATLHYLQDFIFAVTNIPEQDFPLRYFSKFDTFSVAKNLISKSKPLLTNDFYFNATHHLT
jgi:hypothetical protein